MELLRIDIIHKYHSNCTNNDVRREVHQRSVRTDELMCETVALTFSDDFYSSIDLPVTALYEEFQSSWIVAAERVKPETGRRKCTGGNGEEEMGRRKCTEGDEEEEMHRRR